MEISPMLEAMKSKSLTINEKPTKTIGLSKRKKHFLSPQA